jgi:hypothetical protein
MVMRNTHYPRIRPFALSLLLACGACASLPATAGVTCVLEHTGTGTRDTGGADTGTEDDRSTACGNGAVATGNVSTAFGSNAEATGRGGVALGYDSHAIGSATIAIGARSNASGDWSFAIGENSESSAWGAMALGVSSEASGQFSTATGVNSQATGENSLALGGFLGLSTTNVVSSRYTQATAARAIAIGNAAQVHAEEGVALGIKARVITGADRAVAIGSDSIAPEADTVSFGHLAADVDEVNGGAYGSDLQRRLVNVADGIGDHDAATVGQLGSFAATLGAGAGFSGGVFTAPSYLIQDTSYGDVGAAFAAVDTSLDELQDNIDAIPAGSQGPAGPQGPEGPQGPQGPAGTGSALAVEYDDAGKAAVTLGGSEGTVVSNVAAGKNATDAVNKGQLDAVTKQAVKAAEQYAQTGDTKTLNQAYAYTDQKISAALGGDTAAFRQQVDDRFYQVDRRMDRMSAMSSASTQMAINAAGASGNGRVALGVGFAGGKSALSIGYGGPLGDRLHASFGATASGSEASAGFGLGVDL